VEEWHFYVGMASLAYRVPIVHPEAEHVSGGGDEHAALFSTFTIMIDDCRRRAMTNSRLGLDKLPSVLDSLRVYLVPLIVFCMLSDDLSRLLACSPQTTVDEVGGSVSFL